MLRTFRATLLEHASAPAATALRALVFGIGASVVLTVRAVDPAHAQVATAASCAGCHSDPEFLSGKGGTPQQDAALLVPDSLLRDSRHDTLQCTSCHVDYDLAYPHQPQAATATCGSCHEPVEADWAVSMHAAESAAEDAPDCARCHGVHQVLGASDARSPIHPLNEPALCGECHRDPRILETYFADPADSVARAAATRFHETVHGLGIAESGLVVSASCSDCHSAHLVLPSDSARSSVARGNIPATCGGCHEGVLDDYATSAHGRAVSDSANADDLEHPAPVCNDCHSAHGVVPPEQGWRTDVVEECGVCHERLYETYFETYHGKVTRLGSALTAKCSDCHTAHANLPADDPASSVHPANLVETCGGCHDEANARFVQYFPHGTHTDRASYPQMYWTWLLMSSLLVGVFAFFGIHTGLWLYRSIVGTAAARSVAPDARAGADDVGKAPSPGDGESDGSAGDGTRGPTAGEERT